MEERVEDPSWMARVAEMAARSDEIAGEMNRPEVAANGTLIVKLARERGRLEKIAKTYREYHMVTEQLNESHQIMADAGSDPELRELAEAELPQLEVKRAELLEGLQEKLVTGDDASISSVILEIRAGTGGEEAALFARDLFRMYTRYAESQGWKTELMDASPTDLGGMKEVVFSVSGRGAYRKLRYESGGHRVQRVPETESQGRIHTSLATVAVLPEAREVEVKIDPGDVEMSFMRSRGPGGQHVNKTSSCVRLVHKPTGIAVRCQDEKSQQANRKKAMKLLRARLYEQQQRQQHETRDALRRSQVGSGDRNERIRTYNFPQDRITDHRIGLDLFGIESFLMGGCDRMFDALAAYDRQRRIEAFAESQAAGAG